MSFLRKYALWIALATLACVLGSWVIASRQPVQFTASAAVDVEASVIPNVVPVTPNLATELQVVTSGSVLSTAASQLGTTTQQLQRHVSVSNRAGTNILQISCSQPTATAAVSCANAVAVAYAAYRDDSGGSKTAQARDPLHATIVTYAPLPTSKASKRKVELLVLGVIVGLMLGVGTAYLRDRLDDRVRDRADLGRCLNAPVLSVIPAARRGAVRRAAGVIHAPRSPLAEAYRHLRARISPLITSTGSHGKVLLVTSAQSGEGRTSVAINLAAVMALTGTNVLLVDADLRNQTLSDQFQVRGAPGLTDLVADHARIGDVVMPANLVPGLSFMAAGTTADRPGDLLDTIKLRRTFGQLRVIADLIIVDSGPLRAVSDPLALVPVSEIVLMVADVRRTRRGAVTAAAQEVRESGPATLVGVLNRASQPWKRDLAPVPAGPTAIGGPADYLTPAGGSYPAPARQASEPGRSADKPVRADDLTVVVRKGEERLSGDEKTTTFLTAEPSQNHQADGTEAGAQNGSTPSEIEAVMWRRPRG